MKSHLYQTNVFLVACLFASLLNVIANDEEQPYFYILDNSTNKEYKLNLTAPDSAFATTLKINKKIELQFTWKQSMYSTTNGNLFDYYQEASTNLFNFDCDQPTQSHENYDIIAQKDGDSVKLFLIYQFKHNNWNYLDGYKLGKMSGVKEGSTNGQTNAFILGYEGPEYIPPSPDKSPEQNASPSPEQNPKSSSDPCENIKQFLIPVSILTLIIIISHFIFCSD